MRLLMVAILLFILAGCAGNGCGKTPLAPSTDNSGAATPVPTPVVLYHNLFNTVADANDWQGPANTFYQIIAQSGISCPVVFPGNGHSEALRAYDAVNGSGETAWVVLPAAPTNKNLTLTYYTSFSQANNTSPNPWYLSFSLSENGVVRGESMLYFPKNQNIYAVYNQAAGSVVPQNLVAGGLTRQWYRVVVTYHRNTGVVDHYVYSYSGTLLGSIIGSTTGLGNHGYNHGPLCLEFYANTTTGAGWHVWISDLSIVAN